MDWLADLWLYIYSLVNNWAGYATGGIIVALIWLRSVLQSSWRPSRKTGVALASLFLVLASFQAWRDQYRRALVAEAKIKSPATPVNVTVQPAPVVIKPTLDFDRSPAFAALVKKIDESRGQSPSGEVVQRFLREDKIGKMMGPLWMGRGRQIMLMHDGSFEARGFSKQIEVLLQAAGWKLVGSGERFPFSGPTTKMFIKGGKMDDPAVVGLQAAFEIAGFDVQYEPGWDNSMSLWLEF